MTPTDLRMSEMTPQEQKQVSEAMALAAVAMSVAAHGTAPDFRSGAIRQVAGPDNEVRTVPELGTEGAAAAAPALKAKALGFMKTWSRGGQEAEALVSNAIDGKINPAPAENHGYYSTERANVTQDELTSLTDIMTTLTENGRAEIAASVNLAGQLDLNVIPIPTAETVLFSPDSVGDIKGQAKAGVYVTPRLGYKHQDVILPTLAAIRPELVPGMAIVLGIDKFMSECRALTNLVGNGVATVVISRWEKELDVGKLHETMAHPIAQGEGMEHALLR